MPVLYDPLEQVTPRIESWSAVWGGYLIQVAAGFVFGTQIVNEIGGMFG